MNSHEDKESIMRNLYQLKDAGYCINENFTKTILNGRVKLWDGVKRIRGEVYFAVIKYDRTATNKLCEVVPEQVCLIKNLC